MPLLDHFHPPLSERRHWHAFHNSWATYLSSQLNALLPEGYFAEANVQFGVEIDVAAFEEYPTRPPQAAWSPPPPLASFPLELSAAVVEVGVFSRSGGPAAGGGGGAGQPGQQGPARASGGAGVEVRGLLAVGGRTGAGGRCDRPLRRPAPRTVGAGGAGDPGPGPSLSGSAYRPVERNGAAALDVWREPLAVGQRLPTLPLWLRGGLCLPVELEATYERTCVEQRVQPAA